MKSLVIVDQEVHNDTRLIRFRRELMVQSAKIVDEYLLLGNINQLQKIWMLSLDDNIWLSFVFWYLEHLQKRLVERASKRSKGRRDISCEAWVILCSNESFTPPALTFDVFYNK